MPDIGGVPCRTLEPMARHLPLKTGERFAIWVEVNTEAELVAVVRYARAERMPIRPFAPFCDALPQDGDLSGVTLRLGAGFEHVEEVEGGLRVGASALLAPLGLRPGFGALLKAPGTLYDAWEEGWLAPAIVRVRRFKGRGFEEVEEPHPDPKSLVVSAVLRPDIKLAPPKSGAVFKEVRRRHGLRGILEREGLSGIRVHGAGFASPAPEVLVNRGGATARQLRLLIAAVKERVHTATGLDLEERMLAPGRGGRL